MHHLRDLKFRGIRLQVSAADRPKFSSAPHDPWQDREALGGQQRDT